MEELVVFSSAKDNLVPTHLVPIPQQVRELCLSLLPTHPAQDFVVEILAVLTKLAASSISHITSQIHLLLEHLESDPRAAVRRQALSDLRFLAEEERWAHLWHKEHMDRLVTADISLINIIKLSIKLYLMST